MLKTTLAALAGVAALAAADTQFLSTWRAPGTEPIDFSGRKVAAVLIIDDDNLRVSAEEALARELNARGAIGVPAYRIIPKPELKKPDAAKGWFERAGAQGLVVLRLADTDTTKVYSSALWVSGYYQYAWNYWDYGWASAIPLGKGREQKNITVEVLLYDLAKGTPIWAAATRTEDPKDPQTYIKGLTIDVVKKLEDEGLVKKRPR